MDNFSLKATILYLVSMSTFWLLVVAGGGCACAVEAGKASP